MEKHKNIAALYIENDEIGDGFFAPEVARTLREYADMVDKHIAGRRGCELYEGPRRTRLTIIARSWYEQQILRQTPGSPSPPVSDERTE